MFELVQNRAGMFLRYYSLKNCFNIIKKAYLMPLIICIKISNKKRINKLRLNDEMFELVQNHVDKISFCPRGMLILKGAII